MKRNNLIAIILIFVVLALVGFNLYRVYREGTTIDFGTRTLVRDVWGAPPEEKLTAGIYRNSDQNFGWYWERPTPMKPAGSEYVRPIYPNVRIGGSLGESTNSYDFPLRFREVKSLVFNVSYEYPVVPTGRYNLAYEMFLTDESRPGSEVIPRKEMMIWIHRTYPQPAFTYKGDFSDGYNFYELYSWGFPDGRDYSSFILKGEPRFKADHMVDAGKLLANLNVDGGLYLLGVQLGNEIIDGAGKIQINELKVMLNGRPA